MNNTHETVIGLEVHLQFNTATKIFCGCRNSFGEPPNTLTCPVCLGLPGSLPVLNKQALFHAIKVALALSCKVNPYIKFDRKNYYYPDLPKAYQISQYDLPIANNGTLTVPTEKTAKNIRIHRAHLEEDAGKLVHDAGNNCSLVDYNRTGTPLMEIVSEPDMHSPQEAYDYLLALKRMLQYLDVSDCDMEKGSLRCDANISIRPKGEQKLGTKVEIKNLNSFKAVKNALAFEINRQIGLKDAGEEIVQETRLWDENTQSTIAMRSKEEAHDYRYFPEPDLVPFIVEEEVIQRIRTSLPELPDKKQRRFKDIYGLSDYDIGILVQDRSIADFFEACAKLNQDPKKICNWINGALAQELNTRKCSIADTSVSPQEFVKLVAHVENGTLSNLAGKNVLKLAIETKKNVDTLIEERGLAQVSDDKTLEAIVDDILETHTDIVNQVREGKQSAIGFLIGQAMKKSKGKANPKKLGEIIKRRISNA